MGSVGSVGQPEGQPHNPPAANQERSAADQAAERTATATIWIAVFTVILALVGIFTLIEVISSGNDSTDALRLDQRAWVSPSAFVMSAEPEPNKSIDVKISLVNSGKTPALKVIAMTHPRNWNQQPPEVDWSAAEKAAPRGVLAPGITGIVITTAPLMLSNGLVEYNTGTNSIYIQAKITYEDIFKRQHWTTICVLHHHGKPLNEFDSCESGNDVDPELSRR